MATWAPKQGQTIRQAQDAANNSPVYRQSMGFATGRAQSRQGSSPGSTPYQKNPAGDFAAYPTQTSTQRFGNTTLNQSITQGSSPYSQPLQMPTGQKDGNLANFPFMNRPAGFTASYGQPDGSFAESPNYNQRDAFIQALNDQQAPYMTGRARGMPQFDIDAAASRAKEMTQQGFQNPFAAVSRQSFPSQYKGPSVAGAQGFPYPPQEQQTNSPAVRQSSSPAPQPGPYPSIGGGRLSPELEAGKGRAWTPVPGYGFDRKGNQVPVRGGGAARPLTFAPPAGPPKRANQSSSPGPLASHPPRWQDNPLQRTYKGPGAGYGGAWAPLHGDEDTGWVFLGGAGGPLVKAAKVGSSR